ncbi:VOC family protein [Frankia gtarii]|uniref:VOC family protein n=1 Tax=Frankia gtarii TaxID=2950102 RepID=UPI0021C23888|nr:VOC family protein [Frankia gtarii]
MSVRFNHTIVAARDRHESATFLSRLLSLPAPVPAGHFLAVQLADGVTLDYVNTGTEFSAQHYAFLVSDEVFDAAIERIRTQGVEHWADPAQHHPGEINTNDGGRGVYFQDPGGHFMEIITVPYGGPHRRPVHREMTARAVTCF